MIGKKVSNPKKSSSKAVRIGNLIDYMEKPEAEHEGNELDQKNAKCAYSNGINFTFESPTAQRAEMIGLAAEAVRSKDPIDHYVFSWKEGEQPTPEQVDDLVKTVLDEMGMTGHQCRYAMHVDTDNTHVHMAVNRVNPETGKVTHVYEDVDKLHRAVARFEHKHGFEPEPNARYRPNERDELLDVTEGSERGISGKAQSIESRTGQKSAERIAQEEAAPAIRNAESWQQLHAGLAERVIGYETKGSGAVLKVGDEFVKASRAGRDCSLSALEKRLGPYQPPEGISVADRKPEPVNSEQPHWDEYTAARKSYREEKKAWTQSRSEIYKGRTEAFKHLRQSHKKERHELFKRDWKGRGALLNQARSALAFQHAKQQASLTEQYDKAEQALRNPGKEPRYEQFLAERDPQAAQQWRYRQKDERQTAMVVGVPTTAEQREKEKQENGKPSKRDIRDFSADVDEKNGRVLYRRNDNRSVGFIDSGRRVDIAQWKDEGTTLAALQLASQKWGKFQVHGSDEYKTMCVKLAVENGLQISNPELQQAIQQGRAQRSGQRPEQQKDAAPRPRVEGPEDAYKRHREEIRKHFDGSQIDPSRMDWNIAVRMRVTGHSQAEIENTLRTVAAKERPQEKRDWNGYAANTAKRVFGERGHQNALQQSRFRAELMQLEGRDPREIESHEITKKRQPRTRQRPGLVR